jgi:hypothetical protein
MVLNDYFVCYAKSVTILFEVKDVSPFGFFPWPIVLLVLPFIASDYSFGILMP